MKVKPIRTGSLKMSPMRMGRVTLTHWRSRTRWPRLTVTVMLTPTRSQTPTRSRTDSDSHSRTPTRSRRWPRPMGSNLPRVRVTLMAKGMQKPTPMDLKMLMVKSKLMLRLMDSNLPMAKDLQMGKGSRWPRPMGTMTLMDSSSPRHWPTVITKPMDLKMQTAKVMRSRSLRAIMKLMVIMMLKPKLTGLDWTRVRVTPTET